MIVISLLRYETSRNEIISRCIYTLMFCVPFFHFFSKTDNRTILLEQTIYPSIYVLIISGLLFFFFRSHPGDEMYNMPIGYALLFPTSVFWLNRRKGAKYYFFYFIGLCEILILGSRGPLLCEFVLFALTFLTDLKSRKEFLKKSLIVILLLFILIHLKMILQLVINLLGVFNVNSRTLIIALEGGISSLTKDSGRSNMQEWVIYILNKNPFIGYGIAGDIPVLGFYPHNVFLELLFDFGYPLGTIFIISICAKIIKNIKQPTLEEKCNYFLFIACGIVPLFLSDTYLQWPYFWMLIGISRNKLFRIA